MNHIRKVTDLRTGTEQAGILRYAETRNVHGQVIAKHRIGGYDPDVPESDLEDKVTGWGTTVALSVAILMVLAMTFL